MDLNRFSSRFLPKTSFAIKDDEDVLGHPGFVPRSTRRPSQDNVQIGKPPLGGGLAQRAAMPDFEQSEVINEADKYQILLDAWRYEPEEITVHPDPKDKQELIIKGARRDSRTGEVIPGREFTRRFSIPKEVDMSKMTKTYSANGVLVIEAPKTK